MARAEDLFERIQTEGEKVIDEFILTRQSEELFLDFKRSSDDGGGGVLSQTDRNNIGKATSGFGNSEGGVVVWGVDCSKDFDAADVAKARIPIKNVKRFVSWLENAVSGCTIPPHGSVRHHTIVADNQGNGFAVTLIPKSEVTPLQAVSGLRYYIRAGSDFVPIPHAVLAGLFGRRPQPIVFHTFASPPAQVVEDQIHVQIDFILRNAGAALARDLFLVATVISAPGDGCRLAFQPQDRDNWTGDFSFGIHLRLVSKPEYRVPPESWAVPTRMFLTFIPPFWKGLAVHCICGCDGAPPYRFSIEKTREEIEQLYNNLLAKQRARTLTEQDGYEFVQELLGGAELRKGNIQDQ